MTDIQIVFFDIDDTLYRKNTKAVPESALKAIRSLRASGIHTGIATGRTPAAIPPQLQQLIADGTFDVIVSINGQYNARFTDGTAEVLSAHPMDKDFIRDAAAYMQQHGIAYGGVSENAMSSSMDNAIVRASLHGIGDFILDPDYPLSHDIYQMLIFADEAEIAAYHASGIHRTGFEILRWHPNAVDLVQQNGAKARGIKDVCRALNIPIEASMAFGDGHNDVEMMKAVGIGIAMGDAVPEVKAHASYITGTIEEHGIAAALKHFGLIS